MEIGANERGLRLAQLSVDRAIDGIFWAGASGAIRYANDAACRLLGYTREELVGKTVPQIDANCPPQAWPAYWEHIRRRGSFTFESEYITKQGGKVPTEVSANFLRSEGEEYCVATVRDITQRKLAREAAQVAEDRWRAFIDHAVDAFFIHDAATGRVVDVNRRACESLGYTREELIGKHPSEFDSEITLVGFSDLYAALARGKLVAYDSRHRRKDGAVFPVAVRIRSFSMRGHRYALAAVSDITSRQRNEETLRQSLHEKDALLKEVHHRVKNNLQIVSSLLNLQAATIKDPTVLALFADSQYRLRSMALVHETLYRSGRLGSVSLADYLGNLCNQLFRAYGGDSVRIQMTVAIARDEIDLERAIPCGLIVNELVSNALKHAFPQGRAGTVAIALDPVLSNDYALTVADDGIGFGLDAERPSGTLGLQLVRDLVHQLEGDLVCEHTSGTTFRITFPIARPR